MKVISILSGGLDSTILTYKLVEEYGKDNVIALSYFYNQKHSIELEKAKITCKKLQITHEILDISFLSGFLKNSSSLVKNSNLEVPTIEEVIGHPQPITYVPFRNLLFQSLSLAFAESIGVKKVFIGLQEHDLYSYWDTTEEFIKKVNSICELNRMNLISIETPFIRMSKYDEILLGKELNVNFEDTWTCYNPIEKNSEIFACGICPSCSERLMNFQKAGLEDRLKYV